MSGNKRGRFEVVEMSKAELGQVLGGSAQGVMDDSHQFPPGLALKRVARDEGRKIMLFFHSSLLLLMGVNSISLVVWD